MSAVDDIYAALCEMFVEDYGRLPTKEDIIQYAEECGLPTGDEP